MSSIFMQQRPLQKGEASQSEAGGFKIQMNAIHIALGIIFNHKKQILMALRPKNKIQGGVWEFPGGKIEAGETVQAALKRELFEEVGIVISHFQPFIQYHYDYGDRVVFLDAWYVYAFEGEAYGKEGQEVQWVTLEELVALPTVVASKQIIEKLQNVSSPTCGRR